MAKVAYFDCFSGASGDMIIGSLLDAGLDLEVLKKGTGRIGFPRLPTNRGEGFALINYRYQIQCNFRRRT